MSSFVASSSEGNATEIPLTMLPRSNFPLYRSLTACFTLSHDKGWQCDSLEQVKQLNFFQYSLSIFHESYEETHLEPQ